jgi:spore coat polysaccharide biosynthesis protein SpsF
MGEVIPAFVQARMSSRRFPGKVLAPLHGVPVLRHVVDRLARVLPRNQIVIATSTDPSDDRLAAYAEGLEVRVFRGSLDNVFERFQGCLKAHPCPAFFRISADSPLLVETLLPVFLEMWRKTRVDLITNIFPRSWPRGHSVELLDAAAFAAIDATTLTAEQKEHLTTVYYQNPARFRIVNVPSGRSDWSEINLCVDTPEDLERLERE